MTAITAVRQDRIPCSNLPAMYLLYLEALGALVLLLFIVWWTMFSGRKKGELPDTDPQQDEPGDDVPKNQE